MDILTLKYFLAIAAKKNLTGAAGILHISQPALSKRIGALESEIAVLQHKISGGYRFAGNIEIISEDEAKKLDNEFIRLKGICNQLPRYNTKAKMRNIEWPMDVVKTGLSWVYDHGMTRIFGRTN